METPQQYVNFFKPNNKDTRTTSMSSIWCLYGYLWKNSTYYSGAPIFDFEKVTFEQERIALWKVNQKKKKTKQK